jgi:uncharacterized protein YidB (DUF937 family)
MDWLNWLLGSKASTGNPRQPGDPSETQRVLDVIGSYIDGSGGLASVVKRFQDGGFISEVRSWVSTGPNRPINSIQALQLVGWRNLSEMASKAGMSVDRFRDLLAELLPVAIDKATPHGKL